MRRSIGRAAGMFGAGLLALASAAAEAPKVGAPAPDFTLKTVDGQRLTLAELRGQVVVLNFWATWCGPCKRELPLLDGAYRAWKGNGLRVFAITTETSAPLSQLKPLIAALAITPVRSIRGPYAPIGGAVPTNFIIDRQGTVRYAKAAALDLDALNREVGRLLDESAPAATVAAR